MRARILMAILGTLVSLASASSSDCELLVEDFDNAAAADCFAARLAECPGDFALECKLARALIDAGEDAGGEAAEGYFARAVDLSTRMAEEHPESAEGHYYKAVALGRHAQFLGGKRKVALAREIRECVDRALSLEPQHAEALLTRGIYFYELATLNPALRLFAKMLYGGLPEGSLEDAERDLESSRRLAPDNTNTLYHLALVRFERGDLESCRAFCDEVAAAPVVDHLDPRNKALARELSGKAAKKLGGRRTGR